ncbi:MAG: hypothetical protein M3017_12675 [Actinomycetota bacterium]|nr:hypothetical protein [Actinomycetota bacterium]
MRTASTRHGLRTVRIGLGLLGTGMIGYGVLGLPTQLGIAQLVGLLTWMALAVLLHDGVLVSLTTLAGFGLRRLTFGLRNRSAAMLRAALMIGAVVTGLVAVMLKAQSVARNTSVLEDNYAASLAWFWLVLAIVTTLSIYLVESAAARRTRRQNTRP